MDIKGYDTHIYLSNEENDTKKGIMGWIAQFITICFKAKPLLPYVVELLNIQLP